VAGLQPTLPVTSGGAGSVWGEGSGRVPWSAATGIDPVAIVSVRDGTSNHTALSLGGIRISVDPNLTGLPACQSQCPPFLSHEQMMHWRQVLEEL
jgi:hypothetical protein